MTASVSGNRVGTPPQSGADTYPVVFGCAILTTLLLAAGVITLVVWGFNALVDRQRAAPFEDASVVKLTDRIPFDDGLPPRERGPESTRPQQDMDKVKDEIRENFLPLLGRPTAEVSVDCGRAALGSSPFECTARELAPVGRKALTATYTVRITNLRETRRYLGTGMKFLVERTWNQDVRPKKAPVLREAVHREAYDRAFNQFTEDYETRAAACDATIPPLLLLAPGSRTRYRCYVQGEYDWTTYRVDVGKQGEPVLTALSDEEVKSWPSAAPAA
ncbi:hypothetical protein GCM10010329_44170 [Streptomyces spiroverticillatus]|uniref:Uncharacterized protein n=1 Tax=Streptomyces finlayi TaxID=67296 RepID=A0A918WZM1_9ACTN|nr:hypothetical protein [Streptomyces finlayi]GHA16453.1 hypothetical protein GCM10010329_44170 [Streptomyces spiroverticillatus]GHC98670.1 hypothetical protein GCM10010334_41350 [Streptomyces finlayi]